MQKVRHEEEHFGPLLPTCLVEVLLPSSFVMQSHVFIPACGT